MAAAYQRQLNGERRRSYFTDSTTTDSHDDTASSPTSSGKKSDPYRNHSTSDEFKKKREKFLGIQPESPGSLSSQTKNGFHHGSLGNVAYNPERKLSLETAGLFGTVRQTATTREFNVPIQRENSTVSGGRQGDFFNQYHATAPASRFNRSGSSSGEFIVPIQREPAVVNSARFEPTMTNIQSPTTTVVPITKEAPLLVDVTPTPPAVPPVVSAPVKRQSAGTV